MPLSEAPFMNYLYKWHLLEEEAPGAKEFLCNLSLQAKAILLSLVVDDGFLGTVEPRKS